MTNGIEDNVAFDGSVEAYALQFSNLNVGRRGDHASPHKPCMLLAMIDLADAGDMDVNRVRYEPALLDRYHQYFAIVREDSDRPNSYLPFFHLSREPFWHLQPIDSDAAYLEKMKTVGSHRDILENIDHAWLDTDLYRLLQRSVVRDRLREVLISRWFPAKETQLRATISQHAEENAAERSIRGDAPIATDDETVRDTAFRRVVLEAYDYRCAASGMRLVIPGVAVLMDAAHLIPFSESRNDSPTNGMSLTPTYHRALDRRLIAPGPDLKWHVSPLLDSRVKDYEPLLQLAGCPVLFHGAKRYRPSRDSLEWRLEKLRRE